MLTSNSLLTLFNLGLFSRSSYFFHLILDLGVAQAFCPKPYNHFQLAPFKGAFI